MTAALPHADPSLVENWLDELVDVHGADAPDVLETVLARLTEDELEQIDHHWPLWARSKQLLPADPWRVLLLICGRSWGKALDLETPISTPTGWTTMGELRVGDEVFDEAGRPCRVTFATEVQHGRECFDVVFDDGTVIVADADHQWLTKTHATRKSEGRRVAGPKKKPGPPILHRPSIVTTREIASTLSHDARHRGGNHSVDLARPLDLPDAELPIDPYVLGVWLGDGDSGAATLTSADEEMPALLAASGCDVDTPRRDSRSKAVRYAMGRGWLRRRLRLAGLLWNKHIPDAYQRASIAQRRALLAGLLDTDGSVQVGGYVEFLITNARLAEGARELAAGLGYKPTMLEERATLYGRDCGPRWRVSFTPHDDVFRLPRKLARQGRSPTKQGATRRRFIVDVRPRPSVPVRCIQVDSASHLFLASRAMIPTHNTLTVNQWLLREVAEGRTRRFLYIGRTEDEVEKILIKGNKSGLITISPPWFKPRYYASEPKRVEFPNGAIGYVASASEPDSVRGENLDDAVWDEVGAVRPEDAAQVYRNTRLALRGKEGARLLMCTSSRKRRPLLLQILAMAKTNPQGVRVVSGHFLENTRNPKDYRDSTMAEFAGTKEGDIELGGAETLLDEADDDALWQPADFRHVAAPPCRLKRVVVAVDPAISVRAHSDQTGLVAAGLGVDGNAYVLADESGKLADWPADLKRLCREFGAHIVVAEINRGGNLVARAIREAGVELPILEVNSQEAKEVRHDPVARRYKTRRFAKADGVEVVIQGRVYHVHGLDELEIQLTSWHPHESKSPDRIDALVLAVDHLIGDDYAEFDADYVKANESFEAWNDRPHVPGELRDTPRRDEDDDRGRYDTGALGWNGGIG